MCTEFHRVHFLRYFSNGSRIILQGQEVMFSFHSAAVTDHRVSHSSPIFMHICFQRIYDVNDRISTASFSIFMRKVITRNPEAGGGSAFPIPLQPPVPNPAVGHCPPIVPPLILPIQPYKSRQLAAAIPFLFITLGIRYQFHLRIHNH
jgi:hypothetical protein